MMSILFTRESCSLCDKIKNDFDTALAGVSLADIDTSLGLARLTYCGLVEEAKQNVPILLWKDGLVYTYSGIRDVLAPWKKCKCTEDNSTEKCIGLGSCGLKE